MANLLEIIDMEKSDQNKDQGSDDEFELDFNDIGGQDNNSKGAFDLGNFTFNSKPERND